MGLIKGYEILSQLVNQACYYFTNCNVGTKLLLLFNNCHYYVI